MEWMIDEMGLIQSEVVRQRYYQIQDRDHGK